MLLRALQFSTWSKQKKLALTPNSEQLESTCVQIWSCSKWMQVVASQQKRAQVWPTSIYCMHGQQKGDENNENRQLGDMILIYLTKFSQLLFNN